MKPMLFLIVSIAATIILLNAHGFAPFGVSGTGVSVESYQLDPEVNSIILEVQQPLVLYPVMLSQLKMNLQDKRILIL